FAESVGIRRIESPQRPSVISGTVFAAAFRSFDDGTATRVTAEPGRTSLFSHLIDGRRNFMTRLMKLALATGLGLAMLGCQSAETKNYTASGSSSGSSSDSR